MSGKKLSRRAFLRGATVLAGMVVLSACGPTAAPTKAPTKPAATSAPVATAAPATKAPAKAEKISLRIQVYGGTGGLKTVEFGDRFAKANPDIEPKYEEIVYGEIARKTEMLAGTGNLQDICYGHTRWHWQGCHNGFYMPLDDILKTGVIPDYGDFYPTVVENEKWEGKTTCILDYFHCGLHWTWNRDIFKNAGVKPPEPDLTLAQVKEKALQVANKEKGIFGVQWQSIRVPNYTEAVVRAWGKPSYGLTGDTYGWCVQPGGKKYTWYGDTGANRFYNDIYRPLVDAKACPLESDQVEGGLFVAGRLAMINSHVSDPVSFNLKIAGKWGYRPEDSYLGPLGPDGRRATLHTANMMMVASSCKYPQEAVRFIGAVTSTEAGLWSTLEKGTTAIARHSVVSDPKMVAANPLAAHVDKLASTKGAVEPFCMPWNLRYYEMTDLFGQNVDPLYLGTKKWEEQAPTLQRELQKLLDMPRP